MTSRAKATAIIASVGAILGGVATLPSSAAAPAPRSLVTLMLKAPRPAALTKLAHAHGLSHAQRVARLRHLVPSPASVGAVTGLLVGRGMTVQDETAWSVTASGPTTVIGSLFGVTHAAASTVAPALPRLPAALAPYVSIVLPTIGGAPALQHSAVAPVNGAAIRAAYAGKGEPALGKKKVATVAAKATIATLQLSSYHSSDLTTFAKKAHLPKIVGTRAYHPVRVDGGAAATNGGAVEVDLDQESILSTAPSARQRPYFAPNTSAGYLDVFSNVFDDVVQNKHANGAGDPNIVALSTSWGGCESNFGAGQIRAAQTVIKALVAAGVTVFASSGDDGIYDCRDSTGTGLGNSTASVDYPASSPEVVGVGGTNLRHRGKRVRANNGHNWREVAWSCGNPTACESNGVLPILPRGTGGTGGGESGAPAGLFSGGSFRGFPAPRYQHRSIHGSVFANQKFRMVPDIAAVGDPQTGFQLYSSDSSVKGFQDSRGLVTVGGTSLSSPVSAALLTTALAVAGRTTGIGDIHAALYKAYRQAPHEVFRDITSGTNGAAANRGRDPSVVAHIGYDTVSGLGAVLWPRLVPYLLHLRHHKHH